MQPFTRRLRALLPSAAFIAFAMLTQHAQAQLSSAQQSALRANCRSDFMSHCSGVTPGSKDALVCLQKNVARLSPGCRTAVSATLPPPPAAKASPPPPPAAPPPPKPATAAAPPPKATPAPQSTARNNALNAACGNDYLAHCASVPPGGNEALVCLRQHAMTLSVPCKEVLSKMMAPAPKPMRKTVVRAAPPPPAAAPPPPVAVAAAPDTGAAEGDQVHLPERLQGPLPRSPHRRTGSNGLPDAQQRAADPELPNVDHGNSRKCGDTTAGRRGGGGPSRRPHSRPR